MPYFTYLYYGNIKINSSKYIVIKNILEHIYTLLIKFWTKFFLNFLKSFSNLRKYVHH